MKKIISLLVVAALVLSLSVAAFATTPTLTVSSATAEVGAEVTLDVTISETTFAAYEMQIVYDDAALELVSVEAGEEAFDNFGANIETGKVVDARARNKSVEGQLFTMTFKVLTAGEHTVGLEMVTDFTMADQTPVEVSILSGTITAEGGAAAVENPLVLGNNYLEVGVEWGTPAVEKDFTYVAEQAGTLYITFRSWGCNGNNWGEEGLSDSWMTNNYAKLFINDQQVTVFKNSVEVAVGDHVVITYASLDGDLYDANVVLSYDGYYEEPLGTELNPVAVVPDDLPTDTIQIPAGETVYYEFGYDFNDYTLYIYGEDAYILIYKWNEDTWQNEPYYIYAVDGVVEYMFSYYGWYTIQIGNAGEAAASFQMDGIVPLGSSSNPDTLIIGEQTANVPGNYEGYYYTWIATEDGTLTVTVTGDNWGFSFENTVTWECFYNYQAYGDSNTASLTVSAGDEISLNLCTQDANYNTPGGLLTVVAEFTPAGAEPGPGPGTENELIVETTDTYGWFDLYSVTAEVTGTYTFNVPAGLGVCSVESYNSWGNPEIDYNMQPDGGSFTKELTAGEVFEFYVGAATKGEWVITYTVTEGEGGGEGGGEGPAPELPEAIELPLNQNISIEPGMMVVYEHVASGVETLTLQTFGFIMGDVSVEVSVNGAEAVTMVANDQLVYELVAGDVVTVVVNSSGYSTLYTALQTEGEEPECEHVYIDGECIYCGAEDPNYNPAEPDGSGNNPFIIDVLPYIAEQDASDDLYYQWTATENGTLYVYYAEGFCALSGSSVASWEYTEGGICLDVAVDDVITINYWNGTGFTVEFVADSGEAEPGTINNPIAIDSLNITLTIDDSDIYYAWTATEAGEVVIKIAETTWSYGYNLTINGESLYGAGSEMTIAVEAGDQIIVMIEVYPSANSEGSLTLEQGEPVHVHDYEAVVTYPNCTEGGYTTYTCACGDSYVADEVPANGHDYESVVTEPTCTEGGYTTYTCSVCGDTYTEEIAAAGHNYEAVVTAPTCTDGGYTTYICSVCGDTYVADEVAALGHTWDEGVVTKEPTEEAEGEKTFTCTVCGDTKVESIPVQDHVHSYEAVVTEPTCTEGGYTTYTCDCGDTYVADEVAALGHSYESVVTDPTCTEAGCTTYTCSVCGDTYTEEIVATGHNYVDGVCTNCGEKDPNYNPGTGSMNILAVTLIALMSVTAVAVTATKKTKEN